MYTAIEMIALHQTDGVIRPLKFKVDTEDDKMVVKVVESMEKPTSHFVGNRVRLFHCKIIVNAVVKEMDIMYETDSGLWKVETKNQ